MVERYISKCDGLPSGFSGVGGYRYTPSKYKQFDSAMFYLHFMSLGGLFSSVVWALESRLGALELCIMGMAFLGNVYVWTRLIEFNTRMLSGYFLHLTVDETSGPAPSQTLDFYFGDASHDDWVEISREQEEKSRVTKEVCSKVA